MPIDAPALGGWVARTLHCIQLVLTHICEGMEETNDHVVALEGITRAHAKELRLMRHQPRPSGGHGGND